MFEASIYLALVVVGIAVGRRLVGGPSRPQPRHARARSHTKWI